MTILTALGLGKHIGNRILLEDVALTIGDGERVGLVGVNGSGKSTLVRILAGMDQPDAGEVARARGLRVEYVSQEPELDATATAVDAARGTAEPWMARAMLDRLGLADGDAIVGTMSGGERRRVALARALCAAPDLLILDEPTNHLDADSIAWLEDWLEDRFKGGLLVVTHDRYMLDRVVSRTLELDHGSVFSYDGGWGEYLEARAERTAQLERAEANRRNFLRKELEWLRRQPQARSTKQKARIDRAHAVIDAGPLQRDGTAAIAVEGVRLGRTVLETANLAVEIGGRRLVEGLTVALGRGQRIGIVGPSGVGKTTLIRTLVGELAPAAGTVTIGKNTRVAYLDQLRAGLDDNATVFDAVADGRSTIELGADELTVRSYLERFLFPDEKQRQKVGTLSGGERARVALARVLSDGANLVVLDEPTNDLDVTTLAALEEALLAFAGAAIVVTHDRWFLDRVATSILGFDGNATLIHVQGGWQSWQAWRQRRDDERVAKAAEARPSGGRSAGAATPAGGVPAAGGASRAKKGLTYGESIELGGLMDKIAAAETAATAAQAVIDAPGFYERPVADQAAAFAAVEASRAAAEKLVERWAELEAKQES